MQHKMYGLRVVGYPPPMDEHTVDPTIPSICLFAQLYNYAT